MTSTLNLVLHRIVESACDVESRYDVELSFIETLLRAISEWVSAERSVSNVRVYFDDNYESVATFGADIVAKFGFEGVAAVPVESIGQPGFCSADDLRELSSAGFRIVPHGYTHAALALYDGDLLMSTPPGGLYQCTPSGRDTILTSEEVHFQLRESRQSIPSRTGESEFVLPYGLYNEDTISINTRYGLFDFLTTCDPFLDSGEPLRPRYLVKAPYSVGATIDEIRRLECRKA